LSKPHNGTCAHDMRSGQSTNLMLYGPVLM
jgi:hypothetical protein